MVMKAEEDDDDEGGSFLDDLEDMDAADQEEAQRIEEENELDDMMFSDQAIDSSLGITQEEDGNPRRQKQEREYFVGPSRKYLMMLQKENNMKVWGREITLLNGQKIYTTDNLEVKIANLTDRIRWKVLTCRDHYRDYPLRDALVMAVAKRRRLLNRLSEEDLDSYINIRKKLQIRHTYRIDALVNRADEFKYPYINMGNTYSRGQLMGFARNQKILKRKLSRAKRLRNARDVAFCEKQLDPRYRAGRSTAAQEAKELANNDRPNAWSPRVGYQKPFPGGLNRKGGPAMPSGLIGETV